MKKSFNEAYNAERERAIVTIYNSVRRFRAVLDREAKNECFVDGKSAALLQAYVPAQLALLGLMKEESEETDHE